MKSGWPSLPNPFSLPPRWCPWDIFKSFKVCSDAKEGSGVRKASGSYRTNLSIVELQPWFLVCGGKPAFGQNCSLGACVCRERPVLGQNTNDDNDDEYIYIYIYGEGWLVFPDLWCGQKPWWNWYLTPVMNFGEVQRAQLTKSTLLTCTLGPLGTFQIF